MRMREVLIHLAMMTRLIDEGRHEEARALGETLKRKARADAEKRKKKKKRAAAS